MERFSQPPNPKITPEGGTVPVKNEPNETGLSERDRALLEFESRLWPHPGAKEKSIREFFDVSPARYYQLLNVVVDSPEALRHDPILVHRLQRTRTALADARASRVFTNPRHGGEPEKPRPNESTK
jgi:hypothetical protein